MKKHILICLAALLGLMTACVAQAANSPPDPGRSENTPLKDTGIGHDPTTKPVPASTRPPLEDPASLTYTNETLSFQLTFPPAWAGYQVTENRNDEMTSICFTFAGHQPICVLKIDIFSKSAWARLKKVPEGYYLGESDQFVFAAGPHPPQCVQMDAFQCQRYQEISAILRGFHINDPAPATPASQTTDYWVEVEEPLGGVRFAVPCSWEVDLPQGFAHLGTFAYYLRNYPLDYSRSLAPQERVFDRGGIKIDLVYVRSPARGPDVLASMQAYVERMHTESETARVVSTEPQFINGQPSLQVTTESVHGLSRFHLFNVNDVFFLIFAPNPEAMDHPDVQGILHSLVVGAAGQVSRPSFRPSDPPEGVAAPCLGITPPAAAPPDPADCVKNGFTHPDELMLGIRQAIRLRKFGNLVYDFMPDTLHLGMWPGETTALLPYQAGNELRFSLLPEDTTALTYTTDPAETPNLTDLVLAETLGSDRRISQVVYSQGWEPAGGGEALFVLAQDACGKHYWHALVYSPDSFDPGGSPGPAYNLQAHLDGPETLPNGETVPLTFTLTNQADAPLYLLKWYTLLEGLAGEIFTVSREGAIIPYQGILATRTIPTSEAYIYLGAGESVTAVVDLAAAYDFSIPGAYTVSFRSPKISHRARGPLEFAATLDDLGPLQIPSNRVQLTITGSS